MNTFLLEEPCVGEGSPEIKAMDTHSAFSVFRYTPEHKAEWDAFVAGAKNSTFLFRRDYMDYHRDRFIDYSLMILRDGKLAGVMPANLQCRNCIASHQGLTYGGLVVGRSARLREIIGCFHAVLRHLCFEQIARLVYKQIPSFYNTVPDGEVSYILFLLNARLYRRDCAIVVSQFDGLHVEKRRQRQLARAGLFKARIVEESNFLPFWEQVLVPRLASRYGVAPVHSAAEIALLASRFPEHIKQFSVYDGSGIIAGTTIYETPCVAHSQYIASTERGRKTGALDFLFNWVINERYRDKHFFDFGICNENNGRALNHGLLDWKEKFGGRCLPHDFYEISTSSFVNLEPFLKRPSSLFAAD